MKYNRKRVLIKNYKFLQTIGQGRSAEIKLVQNVDNKKHYAVKIFSKNDMIRKNQIKRLSWELRILSNLKGDMFPEFHGSSQTKTQFFIFMEFIPGGDFYKWETHMENISVTSGRFYIGQLIMIIDELHKMDVIYRDLKPENILLGADGYIRLLDFGSSTMLSSKNNKTYTLCGTPEFLSPEVLLKKGHNFAVDFWSLGVFIFELFAKEGPFFDEDPMKLYIKTLKVEYTFPNNFPEIAKSIVRGLLVRNPMKRLGMTSNGIDDLKNNSLFYEYNWADLLAKKITPPIYPTVLTDKDTRNFSVSHFDRGELLEIDVSIDPFILW